jgi:hypothetical protein
MPRDTPDPTTADDRAPVTDQHPSDADGGTTDAVPDAPRRVRDPEADASVFEAGVVKTVRVADGGTTIEPNLREFPRDAAERVTQAMVRAATDVDALSERALGLADVAKDRYEDARPVDVPEGGADLRGLDSDDRSERVRERFEALAAGEEFSLVSDRDPTPVRASVLQLVDADELPGVQVRRQNSGTWLARTTRP